MGLRYMEHFLILTDEPERTRDWWVDTLGFRSGDHPDFGFPVYWLYIGDQDVVHIGKRNHSDHQNAYLTAPDSGRDQTTRRSGEEEHTGRIDHICFNCDGIEEFIERLEKNNVDFSERQAHSQAFHQVFFWEPINAIKIELNFPAEEAHRAGRVAAMNAEGAGTR
jgi:catechol 2,3-dioxygenase-like lactoylglutathione lyase family enzyme